jgi:hypothetical protein
MSDFTCESDNLNLQKFVIDDNLCVQLIIAMSVIPSCTRYGHVWQLKKSKLTAMLKRKKIYTNKISMLSYLVLSCLSL